MRFVACIALFVLVAMATAAPIDDEPKPIYNLDEAPALFEKFIKDYDKQYKDKEDKQIHYNAFVTSLKSINKLNSDPELTATFGINSFTDYTAEEREQMLGAQID